MDNQILDTPNSFSQNQNLPNSTAVLVLGIISIVSCWCFGIIGIICGIIALVLANKDMGLYTANPDRYTVSSKNNLNAGKICAIIGLSLSCIQIAYMIFVFAYVGSDFYQSLFKNLLNN